jgi:hypothetical protein
MLACRLEDMEAAACSGRKFDTKLYGELTGTLGRTLDRLGIADEPSAAEELERKPGRLKFPYAFDTRLSEELRAAMLACKTKEDWQHFLFEQLPEPLLDQVLACNGLKTMSERRREREALLASRVVPMSDHQREMSRRMSDPAFHAERRQAEVEAREADHEPDPFDAVLAEWGPRCSDEQRPHQGDSLGVPLCD